MTRRGRAFTLVEILVAVGAGGLVLVGLLLLSKGATAAFNEELRVGTVQSSVRAAMLRIQSDLTLASYQSTPNIAADPQIVRDLKNRGSNPSNASTSSLSTVRRLAGIRLIAGGSDASAARNVANGFRNDLLEVTGNLVASDSFVVLDVIVGGGGGGCDRILLNMDAPAIWRMRDNTAPDPVAALVPRLQAMFVPAKASDDSANYLVRFVDPTGRSQYLSTCSGRASVVATGGTPSTLALDVAPGVLLTTAVTRGVGGWPGRAVGGCTINPVHTVRYEIGAAAELAPTLAALDTSADGGAADNPKYDLYRTYIDAAGNRVPARSNADPIPEMIAEYIVGLRFGVTVDTAIPTTPETPRALERIVPTDTAGLTTWAGEVDGTKDRPVAGTGTVGPHRIRSVSVEIAARVPLADRDRAAPEAAASLRYCIPGDCVNGTQSFARVRTMTMDVSIPNQTGVFF